MADVLELSREEAGEVTDLMPPALWAQICELHELIPSPDGAGWKGIHAALRSGTIGKLCIFSLANGGKILDEFDFGGENPADLIVTQPEKISGSGGRVFIPTYIVEGDGGSPTPFADPRWIDLQA